MQYVSRETLTLTLFLCKPYVILQERRDIVKFNGVKIKQIEFNGKKINQVYFVIDDKDYLVGTMKDRSIDNKEIHYVNCVHKEFKK